MSNAFVHVELNTTDLAAAKTFYGQLFTWQLEEMPMGEGSYTLIKPGSGTGGGMMKHPMPGAPSAWLPYVEVEDIKVSTAKAKELGANVIVDVMPVAEMGWMSIFIDPTGATLGLWQQK